MVVEFQGALTCRSSTIIVWVDSCPFLGLLPYFGVWESFPRLTNPEVRLRVGHQHSHIRPILVRFMHYYAAFWVPKTLSNSARNGLESDEYVSVDDRKVSAPWSSTIMKIALGPQNGE